MAHIRSRGQGRWQIMYDIDPDPVSGRRRQRSITITGTRTEAERARDRIVLELLSGVHAGGGRESLEGFVSRWLPSMALVVEPATLVFYEAKLRLYVLPELGRRRLTSIGPGHLNGLYARLLASGLSSSTVHHVHRSVHRVFQDAVRWGDVLVNPVSRASSPGPGHREVVTWSGRDVARFLAHVRDDQWWVAWLLLASTGMRRGEVVAVRWADVQGKVLYVQRARKARSQVGRPKTAAGRRNIVLDTATSSALDERYAEVGEERRMMHGSYKEHDLVVAWPDGRGVNPDLLTRSFQRHVKAAGLPKIRLHDLRHTWATLAIRAGVPAKVVSERLGHASIQVTLDTYTHYVRELHDDAAAKVAGLIGLE